MFVVLLTYTRPIEAIDAARPAHREFLDKQYAAGTLIVSGPQVPRTGGVLLARGLDRSSLQTLLTQDPFHQLGLATYQIIEFQARGTAPALAALAEL